MGGMVAPQCSVICGSPRQQAQAAEGACCPVLCATAFTEGDIHTVPEFDLAVADGQLVEVTVTGYVVRTDANNSGTQGGFVYFRGLARRNDADGSLTGLAVLLQDTSLQSLSLGLATGFLVPPVGNTLQFLIGGPVGTYRWDLEMHSCIKNQIVDVVVA